MRASTGITRDEDDFSQIIKQSRYDVEKFTVTFKDYGDGDECNCIRNTALEKSTHIAFYNGRTFIKEGHLAYQAHAVREIGKMIYVKKGITHIYPSAFNSEFNIENQFSQEVSAYLVPLAHDDGKANRCYKNGKPTGNCPRGRVVITQKHYYAPVKITYQLSDLKPESIHDLCIRENGAAFYQGAYHNPKINGEMYEPLDKDYGFLI